MVFCKKIRSSDLTGENKSINYSLLEVLRVLYLFFNAKHYFFILTGSR